jgi:hypothetical protein
MIDSDFFLFAQKNFKFYFILRFNCKDNFCEGKFCPLKFFQLKIFFIFEKTCHNILIGNFFFDFQNIFSFQIIWPTTKIYARGRISFLCKCLKKHTG